jgi:hypothetical protein
LTKRRAHLRPERLDRQRRSNNQMPRDRIGLRDRQVHLCHRAFLEAGLLHVGNDADHAPFDVADNGLPDRIAIGQSWRAIVSFRMITDWLSAISCFEKSRPARSGMRMASR